MAPRSSQVTGSNVAPPEDKWVNVTWMAHTTLAQTSHVCLTVKSAHTTLDPLDHWSPEEWRVRVGVYAIGGLPLVPIESHTPAASVRERRSSETPALRPSVKDATHDCVWNYFVQIPVRWRDLPRDSYLRFEILGVGDSVLYESTMPFFSRYGKLATGLQRASLEQPTVDARRNHGVVPLASDAPESRPKDDIVWKASLVLDQLERIKERPIAPTKADGLGAFGQTRQVQWLDEMTKERSQTILEEASKRDDKIPLYDENADAHLMFEMPVFDIPIMHEETFYPTPQQGASGAATPLDVAVYRKSSTASKFCDDPKLFNPLQLVSFVDYENEHDNPVEDKYRTLAHDLLRGLVDPALKPDRAQRDRLAAIIESTSHHLSHEEKDLLWRFRFSLVDNRRALTKFLLAVDWSVDSEVVQAAELLEQWRKRSPIEVTDALKLLGKHVAFQTNLVRSYAIDTLAAAPDSELRLYLLQLVQALKYENTDMPDASASSGSSSPQAAQTSSLATFLINRAAKNIGLANFLYWYVKVELDNPTHGARYREMFSALEAKLSSTPCAGTGNTDGEDTGASKSFKSIVDSVSSKIGTPFRSDGTGEKERSSIKKSKQRTMWDVLSAQDEFITGVLDIQQRCRDARGKKDVKEEQLKVLLAKEGYNKSPAREPIPLPSAPEVFVNGVHPETAKMFKSALYPALIDFYVESITDLQIKSSSSSSTKAHKGASFLEHKPSSFKVIVKTGDDLRQDQLIMMMIQLMDGLLKRAALDLCLTPYAILATSATSGLVEFVEGSIPMSQILSQHNNSVMQFFQANASQKGAKHDIRPDVMSTYIRSCAGYCVITYLLGVGDRHLDNILLRASGHFFHIDFGFIFGRDPKPLPPAFRLTREMVDGMGGIDSGEYRQFCSLACQAFNALRKSAGLVLNLLHLMGDAGIEDLSNNPSADAEGVIAKVEERFRLDLTDEAAERYFVGLINDCLAALAPRVMDVFHSFSVARR